MYICCPNAHAWRRGGSGRVLHTGKIGFTYTSTYIYTYIHTYPRYVHITSLAHIAFPNSTTREVTTNKMSGTSSEMTCLACLALPGLVVHGSASARGIRHVNISAIHTVVHICGGDRGIGGERGGWAGLAFSSSGKNLQSCPVPAV